MLAVALLLLLAAMPGKAAFEQEMIRPSAELYQEVLAELQEIALVSSPAVNQQAVAREDEERHRQGLAPRFAIPKEVSISPQNDGTWETIDGETLLWRLRVSSPGALSLNLGFTRFYMPEGARLLVYAADQSQMLRPITSRDNASHAQLWTPVIRADEIVVELTIPVAVRDRLVLELGSINVGYRGFSVVRPVAFKAGTCNIDVICPEGDLWRGEISSVAVISTGGSLFCTGFMVNNTAEDQTPYFMTANHCGIKSSNAASLVAYWNFESPTCGQQGGGSLSDWQSGAYFRSAYSASDFTLVELDEAPDPAWNVSFAGWDRSTADPSSAIAIHHPSCDEKSISFEDDATQTTSYLGTSSPGDGTHIRVIDWDLGTTEPGSSGSPLFSPEHRVVGQLHGGYAACGNDESDWYGRFSISWEGGGSSSSRLKDWLDTGNTGAMTIDTLVPGAGVCGDGTCDSGEDQCNCADDCGTPPTTETDCSDGEDNDCDGDTDCDDSDCGGTRPARVTTTVSARRARTASTAATTASAAPAARPAATVCARPVTVKTASHARATATAYPPASLPGVSAAALPRGVATAAAPPAASHAPPSHRGNRTAVVTAPAKAPRMPSTACPTAPAASTAATAPVMPARTPVTVRMTVAPRPPVRCRTSPARTAWTTTVTSSSTAPTTTAIRTRPVPVASMEPPV
jgi:hypothetical protein